LAEKSHPIDFAPFFNNTSNCLKGIRKHYDQAEKHYKKALKLDPDHANNNGNYAQFLKVAIQGPFHQSLVAIGPVASEENILMRISHRVLC
jgi:tetratricopeptide (TPR) repeat protein